MASKPRSPAPKPVPERSQREYGHSSGDRNTRSDEHEWPKFDGGTQRTGQGEPPRPLGYVHPAPRRSH